MLRTCAQWSELPERVLANGGCLALGVCVEAATPPEVGLLERTLGAGEVGRRRGENRRPHRPERLIADRGYDSDPERALLVSRDIGPTIPKRRNNRKATHRNGRELRPYRRRWGIERTNSWLRNFRRPVARYERRVRNFEALVHTARALVALKRVQG